MTKARAQAATCGQPEITLGVSTHTLSHTHTYTPNMSLLTDVTHQKIEGNVHLGSAAVATGGSGGFVPDACGGL